MFASFPGEYILSMAAPSHKTLPDLAGLWKLNKQLSDDISPVLAVQGINGLLTKAMSSASIKVKIRQPKEDQYTFIQYATAASIPGTSQQYLLDNDWRTEKDALYGDVTGRSLWVSLGQIQETMADIGGDWEESEGRLILADGGKPDAKWTVRTIWGFEELAGGRRFVQRLKEWNKKGEQAIIKMVYDFVKD